jgi:hypothetical protein
MTTSAKLSALSIFADVVADATRRYQAGEIDAAGYIAVLRRQGFSDADALAETFQQSLLATLGPPK